MTVGRNVHVQIWRYTTPVDDNIGGAVPTGTVTYPDILARLEPAKTDYMLLSQGIEVLDMYTLWVTPALLNIQEMDEVTVIAPTNHPLHNVTFLVQPIQGSSLHPDDTRGFMTIVLSRKPRAHKLV